MVENVQLEKEANDGIEKFSDILPKGKLLDRLTELEFSIPTEIQRLSLVKALKGTDLILKAQTGSGKTFAFVLPLLEKFEKLAKSKEITTALFISPTRELALQIQQVIKNLNPALQPVLVIGGIDENKQKRALETDAQVIVGTPGRLLDLIQKRIINIKTCRYFVLDEADEMLSMGFIEDIRAILSRLPRQRQGLFVSATISPRVKMLANSFLYKSEYIFTEDKETDKPSIEHLYCEVAGELLAKPMALCDIIESQRPKTAIVFCNTKSETEFVEVVLRRRGFDARRMNSDLSQSQRQKVIAKFKSEELQLLIATDIAARGIDIEGLDLVIHYSLHDQPDTYIHRSGRTGRAGLKGRAISLVSPRDFGSFHYLTKALDVKFQKIDLPTNEEIADARLIHVYEMLNENQEKLDHRAQLSAKKLLKDHGILEHASDDLIEVLGRLCEFTLAHAVSKEAKSLDDELRGAERDRDRDRDRNPRTKDKGRRDDRRGDDGRQRDGSRSGGRQSDRKKGDAG